MRRSLFRRLTNAQDMAAPRANVAVAEPSSQTDPAAHDASQEAIPMPAASTSTPPSASHQPSPTMTHAPAPTKTHVAVEEDASTWDTEIEGQLTIDVYQTKESIVIKSTIAGVTAEDLDISIDNDMVTIEGERQNCDEVSEGDYYYQECYWGGFSRSVILPCDVLADEADAELKNGILTITLPKASSKKAKKIMVKG